MPEAHYEEFKKNIEKRDDERQRAELKKKNASNLPVVGWLEGWLAKRHEAKAQKHEQMAYKAAEKHADALKEKHKL